MQPTSPEATVPHHNRPWTPEEDQLLRDLYDGEPPTTDALVERLQRTRGAVQMRALRLGVAARTSRKWTADEDHLLRELYDGESGTISRIATRLRRGRVAVIRRAGQLGVQRERDREWTPEEDAVLQAEYDSQPVTVRRLARTLSRGREALKRRAGKLGLSRKAGRPWTARDDQTLELLVARNTPKPSIARSLGRTVAACEHRLRVLGIDPSANTLGISDVASMLGTGDNRVRRWIERGMLVTQRSSDADFAHHRVTYRELRRFVLSYLHEVNFRELEQRGSKEGFIDVLLDGQAGQFGAEGFGRGIEDAGALA